MSDLSPAAQPRVPSTLPALIQALPGDPASQFTRERQVAFLSALAACGAVRGAAAASGVGYRTAYRQRRACPAFRRAWDAALLAARALSEDVLACRAIDGIEEQVWYHGEVVATRRRYDSRLLLAHLARLDKLTEDARTRAFADDYEGALERFAAGIDDPAPVCGECGEALPLVPADAASGADAEAGFFSPGPCDKCDTAAPAKGAEAAATAPDAAREPAAPAFPPCPECGGKCLGPQHLLTRDDCQDYDNRIERMEEARPPEARAPAEFLLHKPIDVEDYQLEAFELGVPEWWRVVPPQDGEDANVWHFE